MIRSQPLPARQRLRHHAARAFVAILALVTQSPEPGAEPSATAGWTAEAGSVETGGIETAPAPTVPATPVTQFEDWVMRCETGKDGRRACALVQRLADPKGRKIIQFTVARSATSAYLQVSAPLGLSIPFGVGLVLSDATEVKMELADCDTSGCRAVVPLSKETLARIKGSKRLGVRFQDSKSGKVLTVNGSLKGFASGIAKVLGAS